MRSLADQVIVITGASSGIGRATALAAADAGSRVVLAARGKAALTAVREAIETAGGEALTVPADVADFGQVEALGLAAVARFGRINTWVNCAGISVYGELADVDPAEFRRVIEVDLLGPVHGAKVALAQMRTQPEGGTIVNVSSGLGDRAVPLQSAYCAAKRGLNGFGEALRMELEHGNVPVRVTTVKPASIDTPFFRHARSKTGAAPRPVPPVYAPELVAEAILFAATHPVRDLPVGGGSTALSVLEKVAPRLLDRQLALAAYPLQQEERPKDAAAADNLVLASSGPVTTGGGYGGRRFSLDTWLRLHPPARRLALAGSVIGGLVALQARRR